VIGGRAVSVRRSGGRLLYEGEAGLRPSDVSGYFSLDHDLETILEEVGRDPFMRRVMEEVKGLRILRQDPWPCLCSFILSANNRVDRIDRLVKEIGKRWGQVHEIAGTEVYSLPGPRAMAGCTEEGMRACGTGFRAPYLTGSAAMIASGEVSMEGIRTLSTEEARRELRRLPGVGDKIADCVLLFAFGRYEVFPVDVWILRAVQDQYFEGREIKPREAAVFGREHFGRYAGYAQEYIYQYMRQCAAQGKGRGHAPAP
jgi:N-glycosylase/DNA lyase